MSRGISWRQQTMLKSLLRQEKDGRPVAWRDIDYGPGWELEDWFGQRVQWNIEQSKRRALRSLEQRGLVTLGRYVFAPDDNGRWFYQDPANHVRGQTRIMIGALLTEAGREAAQREHSAAPV